jgi:hypothetical protein
MTRCLCLALLGLFAVAGMVGCEASAKVGSDDDHGVSQQTTVKRESPSGDTVYERKTETSTEVH